MTAVAQCLCFVMLSYFVNYTSAGFDPVERVLSRILESHVKSDRAKRGHRFIEGTLTM